MGQLPVAGQPRSFSPWVALSRLLPCRSVKVGFHGSKITLFFSASQLSLRLPELSIRAVRSCATCCPRADALEVREQLAKTMSEAGMQQWEAALEAVKAALAKVRGAGARNPQKFRATLDSCCGGGMGPILLLGVFLIVVQDKP